MATDGPEAWLGRRVIASGPSPLEAAQLNRKAPGAAAGAFPFWQGSGRALADHPAAPGRKYSFEIVLPEGAEPPVDRAEETERDEDPGLGAGIAVPLDSARPLSAPDLLGDEVMHLPHLVSQVAANR